MKEFSEKIKLSKWLDLNLSQDFPNREDLIELIQTIVDATIPIRGLLEKGITSKELHQRMEIEEPSNTPLNLYEEQQIHEDLLTHSILLKTIQESEVKFAFIASEEAEPVIGDGNLGVTIDPVDGSSNVGVNRTVGTIVGIYGEEGIVCAFYVLYGIFTNLVLCINNKVAEFILDTVPYSLTFYHYVFLEYKSLPDKEKGGIRCLGGLPSKWSQKSKSYEQLLISKEFKDRYSGSFVGDFHAILKYGGVYSYFPSPKGKIRLYYEWLPLAFIIKTLEGDFLIINEAKQGENVKFFKDIIPLTKKNVEKIHATVCGGLLGSNQAVNWYLL